MVAANGVTARFLEDTRLAVDAARAPHARAVGAHRRGRPRARRALPAEPDAARARRIPRASAARPIPTRFPDLSLAVVKLLGPASTCVEVPGRPSAGHFGLAVRDYTHSTAPNRRFPDLVTQRLLKAALAGQRLPTTTTSSSDLPRHCTRAGGRRQQGRAAGAQVGGGAAARSPASASASTASSPAPSDKGTWVRVLQPPVEGRVVRGEQGLDVGDRVRVELVGADVERGFIDFAR